MIHSGFLNIDKPAGITSRDVVNTVVKALKTKRVGHAGTLDPLATGVLVVAVEKATRLVEYVQQQTKVYEAEFRLGARSSTDDSEGMIQEHTDLNFPSACELNTVLQTFVGTIMQVPPRYSAIKIRGKRSYDWARSGVEVSLSPRPVTIHRIDMQSWQPPMLRLRITCGSGTYIRSIARDLGEKLGIGGLMTALRRTEVGCFRAEQSIPATEIPMLGQDRLQQSLRPLDDAVAFLPRLEVDVAQAHDFRNGRRWKGPKDFSLPIVPPFETAIFFRDTFLGIGCYHPAEHEIAPAKGGFE